MRAIFFRGAQHEPIDRDNREYDEQLHDSGEALLFMIDGEKVWIPKSVIEDNDEMGSLEVATWFCEKEELV